MIKKTRNVLLGAGLAVVVALSSFSLIQSTSPMTEKTRVTFHLDSDFGSSLIRVAAAEGIFSKHGIDAKVIDYVDGPAAINAMLSSESSEIPLASSAGGSVTYLIPENRDLKIITQLANSDDNYHWVVKEGKGNGKVSGLKGLKIGYPPISGYRTFLQLSLEDHGLENTDVNLVPMEAAEFAAAMSKGTIDAHPSRVVLTEETLRAVENKAYEMHDIGAYDWFNVLSATESTIKKHQKSIVHVLEALLETQTFSFDNPEKARAAIASSLKISESLVPTKIMDTCAIRLSNGLARQLEVNKRLLSIDLDLPESTYFTNPRELIENNPLSEANFRVVHLG